MTRPTLSRLRALLLWPWDWLTRERDEHEAGRVSLAWTHPKQGWTD